MTTVSRQDREALDWVARGYLPSYDGIYTGHKRLSRRSMMRLAKQTLEMLDAQEKEATRVALQQRVAKLEKHYHDVLGVSEAGDVMEDSEYFTTEPKGENE